MFAFIYKKTQIYELAKTVKIDQVNDISVTKINTIIPKNKDKEKNLSKIILTFLSILIYITCNIRATKPPTL